MAFLFHIQGCIVKNLPLVIELSSFSHIYIRVIFIKIWQINFEENVLNSGFDICAVFSKKIYQTYLSFSLWSCYMFFFIAAACRYIFCLARGKSPPSGRIPFQQLLPWYHKKLLLRVFSPTPPEKMPPRKIPQENLHLHHKSILVFTIWAENLKLPQNFNTG